MVSVLLANPQIPAETLPTPSSSSKQGVFNLLSTGHTKRKTWVMFLIFLAFQLLDRWHLAVSDRNNNDSARIVHRFAIWLLVRFSHGVLQQTVVGPRSA